MKTTAITATRERPGQIQTETRYFISRLDNSDPARLGQVIRAHWSVENNLHWVLDVVFDEDSNRTRKGNSAANLAMLRHAALNLIKNDTTSKMGIKTKRAKEDWNNDYLLKLLGII